MNRNQVKGTIKEAAGKVQRKAGELVDSDKTRAKGLAREVEGEAQQQMGNAQERAHDALERQKR